MRILVSTLSTLMTIWIAVPPTPTLAAEPKLAVRAKGYGGYTNLELEKFGEDAFQGGGTRSAPIRRPGSGTCRRRASA